MKFLRHLPAWVAAVLALGGGVARSAAAEPAAPPVEKTLLVGITWTERREVPAEQAGEINRFESELALALARVLGWKVAFRLGPLDELLRDLAEGRIDFMPGIARTPERLARFDFTVAHSRLNTNLFVRRDDRRIATAADLPGRKVIVVSGSYSERWVRQNLPTAEVIAVPDLSEGVRFLSRRAGDVLLAKQINLYSAMHTAGVTDIEMRGPPVPGLMQDLCCAVRLGNRDLLAQLNEGLFALKQTGELDRTYEKWLGLLEPSQDVLARYRRRFTLVTLLVLLVVAAAWPAYAVQRRRAARHLAEIERRVAERTEELAAAKARFEEVVASTPAGIVLIDPHDPEVPGRIVDCNDLTCRLHG